MEKLNMMVGSFAGSFVAKKFSTHHALKVLRGEEDPTSQMVQVAKLVSGFVGDPQRRSMFQTGISAVLSAEGVNEETVISLSRKLLPFVGVEPPADMEGVVNAAGVLADRVVMNSKTYDTTSVQKCAACGHVQMV